MAAEDKEYGKNSTADAILFSPPTKAPRRKATPFKEGPSEASHTHTYKGRRKRSRTDREKEIGFRDKHERNDQTMEIKKSGPKLGVYCRGRYVGR